MINKQNNKFRSQIGEVSGSDTNSRVNDNKGVEPLRKEELPHSSDGKATSVKINARVSDSRSGKSPDSLLQSTQIEKRSLFAGVSPDYLPPNKRRMFSFDKGHCNGRDAAIIPQEQSTSGFPQDEVINNDLQNSAARKMANDSSSTSHKLEKCTSSYMPKDFLSIGKTLVSPVSPPTHRLEHCRTRSLSIPGKVLSVFFQGSMSARAQPPISSSLTQYHPHSASSVRREDRQEAVVDPPSGIDLIHRHKASDSDPFVSTTIYPHIPVLPTRREIATHHALMNVIARYMDRPLIMPVANQWRFDDNRANNEIGKLLRHYFRGAAQWTKTSRLLRLILWQEFGKRFRWRKEDHERVFAVWWRKCSVCYSDMMYEAWEQFQAGFRCSWMHPHYFRYIVVVRWTTNEFLMKYANKSIKRGKQGNDEGMQARDELEEDDFTGGWEQGIPPGLTTTDQIHGEVPTPELFDGYLRLKKEKWGNKTLPPNYNGVDWELWCQARAVRGGSIRRFGGSLVIRDDYTRDNQSPCYMISQDMPRDNPEPEFEPSVPANPRLEEEILRRQAEDPTFLSRMREKARGKKPM